MRAGKADPLDDGGEDACLSEKLRKRCHFSHPVWGGRLRFWRGLDGNGRKRHTVNVSPYEKAVCDFFLFQETSFFMLSPVSLDQLKISLRIPWAVDATVKRSPPPSTLVVQ